MKAGAYFLVVERFLRNIGC
ncbi:hypothetical protein LINPERPRIM_LOCUS1621 [Linum perenne]